MKFLRGSQNFGLSERGSDKDYIQFYYPSARGVLKKPLVTQRYKNVPVRLEVLGETKYEDIRNLPKLLFKGSFDSLQIMYAKEVEGGEELVKYLRENAEDIVRMNLYGLYKSAMNEAFSRKKEGTGKSVARAIFILTTLKAYAEQGFKDFQKLVEHGEEAKYRRIRQAMTEADMQLVEDLYKECEKLKDSYSVEPNYTTYMQLETYIGLAIVNHIQETYAEIAHNPQPKGTLTIPTVRELLLEDEESNYEYADFTIRAYLIERGYGVANNHRERVVRFMEIVPYDIRKQWDDGQEILTPVLNYLQDKGYYVPDIDRNHAELKEMGYVYTMDLQGYIKIA